MSNHPNRPNNNNDDRGEDSRKLWPFFFIIPILGFSFLPISGSPANDTCTVSNKLCYTNPSFWAIASSQSGGAAFFGICTTSAIYIEGDGGNTVTITSPPSPPSSNNAAFIFYTFFDFDTHVTILGTTGKITLFDALFGISVAPVISREMSVTGLGVAVEESGVLQSVGTSFGPGTTDTFGIAIQRTAGTGSICIDSVEGTAYVLVVGGTPA